MAKIAVTPTIVLAEFILFRKKVSIQKVCTRLCFMLQIAMNSLILGFFFIENAGFSTDSGIDRCGSCNCH